MLFVQSRHITGQSRDTAHRTHSSGSHSARTSSRSGSVSLLVSSNSGTLSEESHYWTIRVKRWSLTLMMSSHYEWEEYVLWCVGYVMHYTFLVFMYHTVTLYFDLVIHQSFHWKKLGNSLIYCAGWLLVIFICVTITCLWELMLASITGFTSKTTPILVIIFPTDK